MYCNNFYGSLNAEHWGTSNASTLHNFIRLICIVDSRGKFIIILWEYSVIRLELCKQQKLSKSMVDGVCMSLQLEVYVSNRTVLRTVKMRRRKKNTNYWKCMRYVYTAYRYTIPYNCKHTICLWYWLWT